MRNKKTLITVLFCLSALYAQADSTGNVSNPNIKVQSSTSNTEVKTQKQLEKRTVVQKNSTTWTKIKDLFM